MLRIPKFYYVYAYMRKDGTPYYIGKGIKYRAWSKQGRITPVPKDSKYIIILEENLTEVGAAAIERRMIRWYGRKDIGTGILRNLTDGGDGWSGAKHTEEQLRKMSETQKGRNFTEEHKRNISRSMMGKLGTFKGRKHSQHSRKKISSNHADISGSKNPMYGKIHSNQTKNKIAQTHRKKWILVAPCGKETIIDDLQNYCASNNFSEVVLWRTSRPNSKNKTYKGYSLKAYNEEQ